MGNVLNSYFHIKDEQVPFGFYFPMYLQIASSAPDLLEKHRIPGSVSLQSSKCRAWGWSQLWSLRQREGRGLAAATQALSALCHCLYLASGGMALEGKPQDGAEWGASRDVPTGNSACHPWVVTCTDHREVLESWALGLQPLYLCAAPRLHHGMEQPVLSLSKLKRRHCAEPACLYATSALQKASERWAGRKASMWLHGQDPLSWGVFSCSGHCIDHFHCKCGCCVKVFSTEVK